MKGILGWEMVKGKFNFLIYFTWFLIVEIDENIVIMSD